MEFSFLSLEEELRNLILNVFFEKNVEAWNCRFEECKDYIIIDGIPMQLLVGDFVYKHNSTYFAVELKFVKIRSRVRTVDWKNFRLWDTQYKMIRGGGGFLVMVAETLPTDLDFKELGYLYGGDSITNNEQCEKLIGQLRERMGQNTKVYEVLVIGKNGIEEIYKRAPMFDINTRSGLRKCTMPTYRLVKQYALKSFTSFLKDLPYKVFNELLLMKKN